MHHVMGPRDGTIGTTRISGWRITSQNGSGTLQDAEAVHWIGPCPMESTNDGITRCRVIERDRRQWGGNAV